MVINFYMLNMQKCLHVNSTSFKNKENIHEIQMYAQKGGAHLHCV